MAKKNSTKNVGAEIFLLGYTDAAWRVQKLFKSGVDHKWIPHLPPLLILQRRHSTTYGCVGRSLALFVFIVHFRPTTDICPV